MCVCILYVCVYVYVFASVFVVYGKSTCECVCGVRKVNKKSFENNGKTVCSSPEKNKVKLRVYVSV